MKQAVSKYGKQVIGYAVANLVAFVFARVATQQAILRGKRPLEAHEATQLALSGFGYVHPIGVHGAMGRAKWLKIELAKYEAIVRDAFLIAAIAGKGCNAKDLLFALQAVPIANLSKCAYAREIADVVATSHAHLQFVDFEQHFQAGGSELQVNSQHLLEWIMDNALERHLQSIEFWEAALQAIAEQHESVLAFEVVRNCRNQVEVALKRFYMMLYFADSPEISSIAEKVRKILDSAITNR